MGIFKIFVNWSFKKKKFDAIFMRNIKSSEKNSIY